MKFSKYICGVTIAAMAIALSFFSAHAADLTIKEKTTFYTITGKTAAEFAAAMGKRGPYSLQHRRRAWATAHRDLSYQLTTQKTSKGCRVRRAKVKLTIAYTLPKLGSSQGISKRHRNKWKQMKSLLVRHEKVHGTYYKQFARNVQKALKKLPRASSCRKLTKNAKTVVEKLNKKDRRRNNRFDAKDTRNYKRMVRIYRGS